MVESGDFRAHSAMVGLCFLIMTYRLFLNLNVWIVLCVGLLACGGQSASSASHVGGARAGTSTVTSGGGSTSGGATDRSSIGGATGYSTRVTPSTGGNAVTTTSTSDRCAELAADYGVAVTQSTGCDPELSSRQCQAIRSVGLHCGCEVVVNALRSFALDQLDAIEAAWSELSCGATGDSIQCGECARVEPDSTGGGCNTNGRCASVPVY